MSIIFAIITHRFHNNGQGNRRMAGSHSLAAPSSPRDSKPRAESETAVPLNEVPLHRHGLGATPRIHGLMRFYFFCPGLPMT